jgi:hypothetical protein
MYNKDKLFSKIDLLEREKCMINVFFEKLYRYDRKNECVGVGIPFKKGRYFNTDDFIMVQNGEVLPRGRANPMQLQSDLRRGDPAKRKRGTPIKTDPKPAAFHSAGVQGFNSGGR